MSEETDSEEVPEDLEAVIDKLSQDPDNLTETEKAEISEVLSKYLSSGEIELEAVCNANGGRSPAMQVLLLSILESYGIIEYFRVTSSGSKLEKVVNREQLKGAFRVKIMKKALKDHKENPIYTSTELKEAEYALSILKAAGDDKEAINKLYDSNSKLKAIVDRLDEKGVRVLHRREAEKRDRVLEKMGLYGSLLATYYDGRVPPTTFPGFYSNRTQTKASATKIYIAAEDGNVKEITEICEKAGVYNPTILPLGFDDTLGGGDKEYIAVLGQVRSQLQDLLPTILITYAENKTAGVSPARIVQSDNHTGDSNSGLQAT